MPTHFTESQELTTEERRLCDAAIRHGSKSFHAASCLLPPATRSAARGLYAFCRASDDLIDEQGGAHRCEELRRRIDLIYQGTPEHTVGDRSFAAVARAFGIPRKIPDALIEGFEWDEQGKTYETLPELLDYAARVAGTVGVMMSLIMGRRDPNVLARAADLGLAMQLTNIARDVGEDARNGRIYLPLSWLRERGTEPDAFLASPHANDAVLEATRRLLREADKFYARAWSGIGALPARARPAIAAAALIYRDIGRVIALNGYDSVSMRAHTGTVRKLALIARATGAIQLCGALDSSPPDASTACLVGAAGKAWPNTADSGRVERFIDLLHTSAKRRNAMSPTQQARA